MRRSLSAIGAITCALAVLVATAAAPAQARTTTLTRHSQWFTIGAFQTTFPKVRVRTPAISGYITSFDAKLVYSGGRQVSIREVMLHHVVFINQGVPKGERKKTSCPGRGGEPFWGTGEEKQPLILPAGYGYRVAKRDHWSMQAMLMSHGTKAHRVRVQYTMRIVSAKRMTRVKPLWLRANSGCARHPSYDIEGGKPPGSIASNSHLWRMPLSGRIVASSAHLHGSSYGMTVSQPRCKDRVLIDHKPRYGDSDDIVYRARPILHEPGPIAIGQFQSRTGLPVRKGEMLKVTGFYDSSRPHPRVMAITHVYVAVDAKAPRGCRARPSDARTVWTRTDGRSRPPVVDIPLNAIDRKGRIVQIDRPPGRERVVSTTRVGVDLHNTQFSPANLSVPLGSEVTWRFTDLTLHNVTLASGPRFVASPNFGHGRSYTRRLRSPGTYKLFCYLHPLTMTQVITVRP